MTLEQLPKYHLVQDQPDDRDFIYAPQQTQNRPTNYDLRPKMVPIPVFDQLSLGSCTANAIVALKEYRDHIENEQAEGYFHYLSRLFLYWQERNLEGTTQSDSGAYIRDGFRALQKIGVCGESFFPYDPKTFTNEPTLDAVENAKSHRIEQYSRVYGLDLLKSAISEGNPVVIGIPVYPSFETNEVAKTGYVPMPHPDEQELGGHAILAVGYTETHVICRNSWGEEWGDKGYFYLPNDYITRYVYDAWTGF